MKNKLPCALTILSLLLCLSNEVTAQLGLNLVIGSNLNIGSGNSLLDNGNGNYSGNAIGLQNHILSANSLAVGSDDTIASYSASAVTLGASNKVQGVASMGFGCAVKVSSNYGVGIGHHIKVNGTSGSMVIGNGIIGSGMGNDSYLVNENNNSLAIGFNSTRPTLFVSQSPNNFNQGILDRTGMVAIGDVTPQAKLHIRSDQGEDAGIILVPADLTKSNAFIQLRDDSHQIVVNEEGNMLLTAGSSNQLDFTAANISVTGTKLNLGSFGERKISMVSGQLPALYSNAHKTNDVYYRFTSGPSYALEFGNTGLLLRTAVNQEPRTEITNWRNALSVKTDGAVTLNGRVGVNIENTTGDYALAVAGGVITTKVHIQDVADWNDHVFDRDYALMPLGELEAYVAANRHLPDIPSEAEVKAEGYDVAEMQAVLLGKIEELTLYIIRQQKEIDSLRTLVTVQFGYDACGNRVSRTLEFSRSDESRSQGGDSSPENPQWQAMLSDVIAGTEATLFPNPTEGGFFLLLSGDLPGNATASLCTIDGTILEERTTIGVTEEFDLSQRSAGIYLLRLSTEHETRVWKVIKRN